MQSTDDIQMLDRTSLNPKDTKGKTMTLYKRYLKENKKCRVKFILDHDICPNARSVHLVGEFNHWDKHSLSMRKLKDGSFSIYVTLESGHEYQFRYLVDGTIWENDWHADKYVPAIFSDIENSVVVV